VCVFVFPVCVLFVYELALLCVCFCNVYVGATGVCVVVQLYPA